MGLVRYDAALPEWKPRRGNAIFDVHALDYLYPDLLVLQGRNSGLQIRFEVALAGQCAGNFAKFSAKRI
jgi:hypothetical protein